MTDAAEASVAVADLAVGQELAASTKPAEPVAAAKPAEPAAKSKAGGFLRQIMAIKRQNSDPKMPKAPGAPGAVTQRLPPRVKAAPTASVRKADGNGVSARPARTARPRLLADKSVQLKTVKDMAARRLGLPLKGDAPRAGAGSGLWKRSMRNSVLASATRATATVAARLGTAAARLTAPQPRRLVKQVPRVMHVQQDIPRRVSAVRGRGDARRDVGRALAAAVGAAVSPAKPGLRSRLQASGRTRPAFKFGGLAGALLPVKKEEGSDNETMGKRQQQRGIPKVTTVPRTELRSAAAAAARSAASANARGALTARARLTPSGGFGYGDASEDESDESGRGATANGRPQKLKRPLATAKAGKGRPQVRTRNIAIGLMQRHLGAAHRQLTDERTSIKVKEEARWEPEASPPREDEEDASRDESAEVEESPPRKRAKREPKLSPAERKRQQKAEREREEEEEAKAEAKEMQSLQRRLESHYSSMKNFIRTRAEPTIFYLPAKHNSESQRQLEETRAAINQKIASLKVHLQSVPADEDEDDDE